MDFHVVQDAGSLCLVTTSRVTEGLMVLGPGRFSLDAMLLRSRDWVVEEKKEWLKISAA